MRGHSPSMSKNSNALDDSLPPRHRLGILQHCWVSRDREFRRARRRVAPAPRCRADRRGGTGRDGAASARRPRWIARILNSKAASTDWMMVCAGSAICCHSTEIQIRSVGRLLDLFHQGQVQVRRYTHEFLHAKAYLFRTIKGGVIVGSSNFTYGGLTSNLELNLGDYDPDVVARVEEWFDKLWENAEPYDLASFRSATRRVHAILGVPPCAV